MSFPAVECLCVDVTVCVLIHPNRYISAIPDSSPGGLGRGDKGRQRLRSQEAGQTHPTTARKWPTGAQGPVLSL